MCVTTGHLVYATCVHLRQPSYPIPQNADQVAQQALAACQRAWKDGVRRQQLELLLPLIGASDIDDWCATYSVPCIFGQSCPKCSLLRHIAAHTLIALPQARWNKATVQGSAAYG